MQEDFHYYATYCASYLAGFSHEDSLDICYSAQFVDHCSKTLLQKIKGPKEAATTQLQLELMDSRTDAIGLQNITRIWTAFHFLPGNLNAPIKAGRRYREKYRLICGPNGELAVQTVELAKGKSLQAAGVAMHVLADTWAHRYFAGTPSLVINNISYDFYEIIGEGKDAQERRINFRHSARLQDDPEKGEYTSSVLQNRENNIMNLGHGRAGHLPDYSFARYRYLPAWGNYAEIVKDNPDDYMHAFMQMVQALRYLRGHLPAFETNAYDWETIGPYENDIREILSRRQLSASEDWRRLGQRITGHTIEDFDLVKYQQEYVDAPKEEKGNTFLGKFMNAAMEQKGMVAKSIAASGNRLVGLRRPAK